MGRVGGGAPQNHRLIKPILHWTLPRNLQAVGPRGLYLGFCYLGDSWGVRRRHPGPPGSLGVPIAPRESAIEAALRTAVPDTVAR